MLKPTIKKKGSTDRERYLEKLANTSFFGLWSYPSLYTDEGINKHGIGEELCDLLVVFGKDIIVFSDKDVKFNGEIDLDIAWKRWFKRAVSKSCRQLYGAKSWIRKYPDKIFLDERCSVKIPFELTRDINIHLVAVTCNSAKFSDKYFGEQVPSSFVQHFSLNEKECLEKPFHVGWLDQSKKYIHILDERSLDLLLSELDTIYDFINYLNEKETAIVEKRLSVAAGEEEILAYYYREQESLNSLTGSIGKLEVTQGMTLVLQGGIWEEYIEQGGGRTREKIRQRSIFWDSLINRFSAHILSANVGLGQDLSFEVHERAIRFLASECRLSRSFLATAFLEKLQEVPSDRRSARLIQSPQYKSLIYVFVFLPRDEWQSDKDYREERSGYNYAYALVAKYLNPSASNVVVLATDTKGSFSRSEDVLAAEFDQPLSDEELRLARQYHEKENILKNTFNMRRKRWFENSRNMPYINKDKVCGRNDKCPCGSGKKYKKCCMK